MFCRLVPVPQGDSDDDHLPVSVPATLYEQRIRLSLSLVVSNTLSCLSMSRSAMIVLQNGLALGYSLRKCSSASLSVETFCLPFL